MSEDALLGRVFCVPRRLYCILLGLALFLSGFGQVIYFIFFHYLRNYEFTPRHCDRADCFEIATCHGMQDGSMHFRAAVLIVGGTYFGAAGALGAHNTKSSPVLQFACFLGFIAVAYVGNYAFDFGFTVWCDRYTTNILDMAIHWPIPSYPVADGIKNEVRAMRSFPIQEVNEFTHTRIWALYTVVALVSVLFWAYSAYGIWLLGCYLHGGTAGLGPNFSFRTWRDEVLMTREVQKAMYSTEEAALSFISDIEGAGGGYGAAKKIEGPPFLPKWENGHVPSHPPLTADGRERQSMDWDWKRAPLSAA